MGYVSVGRHVEVVAETAFDFLAGTARLPLWLALMSEVEARDDSLAHEGAAFDGVLKVGGRQLDSTWHVTKVTEPRLLRLSGEAANGGSAAVWLTVGRWDGGCEVTFEVDYDLPGGFVSSVTDRLFVERAVARDIKHSMDNLKAILEGQTA